MLFWARTQSSMRAEVPAPLPRAVRTQGRNLHTNARSCNVHGTVSAYACKEAKGDISAVAFTHPMR